MKTPLLLASSLALLGSIHAQPIGSSPSHQPNDLSSVLRSGIEAFTGGSQQGQLSLQQVTANWNETARTAARKMFDKYGAPQEVTANRLVWRDNRPWKSTTVINQEVPHNFPVAHTDVLEQTLAFDVPVEKFSELAQFDGSVTAERTSGELSGHCDQEASNFIALNLANDLIAGKVTVEQARQRLTELVQAVKDGQQPAYATDIRFSLPVSTRTGDPDRTDGRKGWQRIGW